MSTREGLWLVARAAFSALIAIACGSLVLVLRKILASGWGVVIPSGFCLLMVIFMMMVGAILSSKSLRRDLQKLMLEKD